MMATSCSSYCHLSGSNLSISSRSSNRMTASSTVRFSSSSNLTRHCPSLKHIHRWPTSVRSAINIGGGNIGGGNRGGGGGGGDGGDSGESKNKKEALPALPLMGISVDSVPNDLAAAIQDGRIPAAIVQRFTDLEKSPFFRWLMQFGGFKERLLADDSFLAKAGFECGAGILIKFEAE